MSRTLLAGLVLTVFNLLPTPQRPSEPVIVVGGFITGNRYQQEMNAEEKTAYIEGVCDGFLMAPAFGAPNSGTKPLLQCISGMNNAQVTAIFDKYLAERPERWHVSANMLMHEALVKACKLATPKK